MSYIDIIFSPYRGNLSEEIGEILSEDHEMVLRQIESRGLLFLIGYIMVMFLSLIKVFYHIYDHFKKPERPKD
jgi:cbb3-type cytochrome oxidase subunit 3